MAVGTNSNSLRAPRRKITVSTKENTRIKKNTKSNVSSKKENVSSKQTVSKTKAESDMLKKNHSIGPKTDPTRVLRFVDMSTIKPKPRRRRRVVSNYPSTALSIKKAKTGTLILDEEGKTPYNISSAYYDNLLKIPSTTCFRPFDQNDYILPNKQFTPTQICPLWQQPRSNNFTTDIVTPPSSLTNFEYLKEDVTDSTSISKSDTTACEVSSISTDSTGSARDTLHYVTYKRFVEEPKLRKSGYGDENGEKYPIGKEATNFHYNNIKKDQQTDNLSTASSSTNDVSTTSFVDEPKLGKFGYGDGNKKYLKGPNFFYNNIKEDENVSSSDSTEGILEEISIEDFSASVVNANIFNNKLRRAKISSRHKQHRKKLQMKPCLESVKEDLQLEQNLLEIGDGCHNVESYCTMDHIKPESYLESQKGADFIHYNTTHSAEVERAKSRSESQNNRNTETSNTIAYPKGITKPESYTENQERMNFKTDDTLANPKNDERTVSYMQSQKGTIFETNNTMTSAKANRRSPDSQKRENFVSNTVGERPKSTPDRQSRTNVEKKFELFSGSQEDSYIEMNNTLTYPKGARRIGSYLKSQKRRMIDTMSYPKGYYYNTEVGRSKFYLESQTSNTMVYPKKFERGELYSDCQEKINSVYNNTGHNTTEVEKPKSCPKRKKMIDVETNNTMAYPKEASNGEFFSDLLQRLDSLYANITHCMTDFETAKSCLEYRKNTNGETNSTIASKKVERLEFYSEIQNRLNMIYGKMKYFTIELEAMKSCLECQKSLYVETSNAMAHRKNASQNETISRFENDKAIKYAKQVEISETDIEDTISFETDEIVKYYADTVEQVESLSEIDLSNGTTETCSSEGLALVQSCSSTTVCMDTSSCSDRSTYNMRHLKFLLQLHSTLSGFLHQCVECPL